MGERSTVHGQQSKDMDDETIFRPINQLTY